MRTSPLGRNIKQRQLKKKKKISVLSLHWRFLIFYLLGEAERGGIAGCRFCLGRGAVVGTGGCWHRGCFVCLEQECGPPVLAGKQGLG